MMKKISRYDFDDMINWVLQAFQNNANLLANYQERFGPFLVWAKALLTQTYNWNHWYDPAGTGSPMRANGYNLKSLNVFTGVTILL